MNLVPRPSARCPVVAPPLHFLYLCQFATWQQRMARDRAHQVRAISKLVETTWWGPGWQGWREELTVQENLDGRFGLWDPDLIIAYKPLEMRGFAQTRAQSRRCPRHK